MVKVNDDLDTFLESLPPKLRRQAMAAAWASDAPDSPLSGDSDAQTARLAPRPPEPPTGRYFLALLIGLPIALVGLFLCATIIFAFAGIPLLLISGMPLGATISAQQKKRIEWEHAN